MSHGELFFVDSDYRTYPNNCLTIPFFPSEMNTSLPESTEYVILIL